MDKLTEAHAEAWTILEPCCDNVRRHASITREYMGRFAEWVRKSGYRITDEGLYWYKKGVKIEAGVQVWFTESELIQLFKQTL